MSAPRPEAFLLLPGDGLMLVLASGTVVHLDPSACCHLGEGAEAFSGCPVEAVWPELAAAIDRHGARLEQEGPLDLMLPWREGERAVRLFRTDDGVGIGLIADAGETREAGKRLELFENLLHAVRDVVVVTTAEPLDSAGPVILYANAATLHHTGYELHEVLGRSPRLLQGPDTDPEVRAQFRRHLQAWDSFCLELLNNRKDGSTFWSEIAVTPLQDESGWFTHWVAVQRDVTARHHTEQALQEQALIDAVTGLPNRRALGDRIALALRRLKREEGQLAVMFCDLNHFKQVNDTHGHDMGDALLATVAGRLQAALRPGDTVVRLGGDEFVIVCEGIQGEASALQMAWRLQNLLGEAIERNGVTLRASMSVGIAVSDDPRLSPHELVRRADVAMYRVKRQRDVGVLVYEPSMDMEEGSAATNPSPA